MRIHAATLALALVVGLLSSCVALPYIVVYNNVGRPLKVYVKTKAHQGKEGPLREVVIAPRAHRKFWLWETGPGLLLEGDGCTYAYDPPDGPRFNEILVQVEPNFSIHLLAAEQERVEFGRFVDALIPGFPVKPISKVCH